MENDGENEKFVALVDEFKVILEKSQNQASKEAKQVGITALIQKWSAISGKTLTQKSILKKLSNLKVRSKSAEAKNQPLCKWQSKLLEITKGTDDDEEEQLPIPAAAAAAVTPDVIDMNISSSEMKDCSAEDIVNQYETPETKKLNNNQLKRIILLEQIKIVQLKRMKMENRVNAGVAGEGPANKVEFEYIGWNGTATGDVQQQ